MLKLLIKLDSILLVNLFVCGILSLDQVRGGHHQQQQFNDGDCLDYRSFNHFRYSPNANYDPNKGINGSECARICSESNLPHAGLVSQKYCLCASPEDFQSIRSIPKVSNHLCDEGDLYLRYFRGEPIGQIDELTIALRKKIHLVDDEVYFDLKSIANGPIEYSIDFGDGNDRIEWNPARTYKHRYHLADKYLVQVQARLVEKPNIRIKQTHQLRIHSKIRNDSVKVSCPKIAEPDDRIDCDITITIGTLMQMLIDFGDGYQSKMINLPG